MTMRPAAVFAIPQAARSRFASAVYRRGAMTLQALRTRIGDGPFIEGSAPGRPSTDTARHDGTPQKPTSW